MLQYFLKFLSVVRLFAADVSLVRHFTPKRFTACPSRPVAGGGALLQFFTEEITGAKCTGHLDRGVSILELM